MRFYPANLLVLEHEFEKLKDSKILLILTGSSIGMMENEVLSSKSPCIRA